MTDEVTRFWWWTTGAHYTRPWTALSYLSVYDLDSVFDPEDGSNRDHAYLWLNNNRILYHIEWDNAGEMCGAMRVAFFFCFIDKAEAAKFKLYFPNYKMLV